MALPSEFSTSGPAELTITLLRSKLTSQRAKEKAADEGGLNSFPKSSGGIVWEQLAAVGYRKRITISCSHTNNPSTPYKRMQVGAGITFFTMMMRVVGWVDMSIEREDLFKVGSSNCCSGKIYNDGRCAFCLEMCEEEKDIYHFLGKKKLKTPCGRLGGHVDFWTSDWKVVNCEICLKSKVDIEKNVPCVPSSKSVSHDGEKRQVIFENVWLLYNYSTFHSINFTRAQAWSEAWQLHFGNESASPDELRKMREMYQVLRGDVAITLHKTKKSKRGPWAVFHKTLKLNKQFPTEVEAQEYVSELLRGNETRGKYLYTVKKL